MHINKALLLSAFVGTAVADCVKDNCYRAVIASAFTTRPTVADCSSFLQIPVVTVTPPTVTETTTTTQTNPFTQGVTDIPAPGRRRRGALPPGAALFPVTAEPVKVRDVPASPTLPPYASEPCKGNSISRYSSACSCLSITMSTTTVPTPTVTVTTTATTSAAVATVTANIRFSQFDNTPGGSCDSPKSSPPPLTVYANQCTFVPAGIKLTLTPFNLGSCTGCTLNRSFDGCASYFAVNDLLAFQGCYSSGGSGWLSFTCSSC